MCFYNKCHPLGFILNTRFNVSCHHNDASILNWSVVIISVQFNVVWHNGNCSSCFPFWCYKWEGSNITINVESLAPCQQIHATWLLDYCWNYYHMTDAVGQFYGKVKIGILKLNNNICIFKILNNLNYYLNTYEKDVPMSFMQRWTTLHNIEPSFSIFELSHAFPINLT